MFFIEIHTYRKRLRYHEHTLLLIWIFLTRMLQKFLKTSTTFEKIWKKFNMFKKICLSLSKNSWNLNLLWFIMANGRRKKIKSATTDKIAKHLTGCLSIGPYLPIQLTSTRLILKYSSIFEHIVNKFEDIYKLFLQKL